MAKGKGTGKPCGATHIAQNRVCRVNMPSAVARALEAVTGEVGAKTLWHAVQKHAGKEGMARLREIRADVRNEMGGNIVKGPKAEELKKRLQAEGLLPNGKPKSVAPDVPLSVKKQLDALAAQGQKKPEVKEWKPNLGAGKPDSLYGAWDKTMLEKHRDFILSHSPAGTKRDEQIARINNELARKQGQVRMEGKGKTDKEMEDLSRIMRGESPKYMDIVSAPGELGMGARAKSKSQIAQLQSALGLGTQTRKDVGRDLEGLEDEARNLRNNLKKQIQDAKPGSSKRSKLIDRLKKVEDALAAGKTNASTGTKYARESARDFDDDMRKQDLRRDGKKTFDKWSETSGSGAKKLGQGAYGTVIKSPDNSYAVKRGDISDTEARLIQKLGDRDLGPKLIAADVDGPGWNGAPGVNNRRGRLAMSIVPGKPIGQSAPDKEVGGVKVADAYWKARADLHRMGIAHNDMHIDNVLVDKKGKGRFVDMGLAQDVPKAALAEALGAFDPPRGGMVTRPMGVKGQGDWQARRWEGTGGRLLARATRSEADRKELEQKAPLAARALDNKNALQYRMQKDGFSKDDIATMMDHGLRNDPSTYNQGVWQKVSDQQAMEYINILYEGI